MELADPYGTLGRGYDAVPRPDPRLGRLISVALGPAGRVLNVGAGLAELRRVSRRQVVLTWDPSRWRGRGWSRTTCPRSQTPNVSSRASPRVAAALARTVVEPSPVPWDCSDGFLAAYCLRPTAHLDEATRAGASDIGMLSPTRCLEHLADLGMDAQATDLFLGGLFLGGNAARIFGL